MLRFNDSYVDSFVSRDDYNAMMPRAAAAFELV